MASYHDIHFFLKHLNTRVLCVHGCDNRYAELGGNRLSNLAAGNAVTAGLEGWSGQEKVKLPAL